MRSQGDERKSRGGEGRSSANSPRCGNSVGGEGAGIHARADMPGVRLGQSMFSDRLSGKIRGSLQAFVPGSLMGSH